MMKVTPPAVALRVYQELLQGLECHCHLLSPEERSAVLELIDNLDESLSGQTLDSQLAVFLESNRAIEDKLMPLSQPSDVPQDLRLAGVQPIINANQFKDQVRNIILRPSGPRAQDGGSKANR